MRNGEIAEPEVALDVRAHDLVELLIADAAERAVIRIHGGVADQNVDAAVLFHGAGDQRFDFLSTRDVARDDGRLAALLLDAGSDLLAGVGLAARHHHLGAEQRAMLSDRPPDTAARAGNDGDFVVEAERRGHGVLPCVLENDARAAPADKPRVLARRKGYSSSRNSCSIVGSSS